MVGCTNENWTLQYLSSALQDMHKDNKKIVVPMFQRGKRWSKSQEKAFIDSLVKGYPVGTMLFYETFEENKRTYILVDGLQRGNSIKNFMNNPTEFFFDDSISDKFCASILGLLNQTDEAYYAKIRTTLTTFIKEQKTFKNLQYYSVAKQLTDDFGVGYEFIGNLIDIIKSFFEERQDLYDRISNTVIPVIVYTGDESNLPDIFDRINSKGSVLILNGPQGIGKSTFYAKLAGDWFSDSLTLTDMKDKAGPEKLQGYWMLELGELAGMRKTDVEVVKSFISRCDDKYRASYGVNVESHPRQCVSRLYQCREWISSRYYGQQTVLACSYQR